MTREQSVWGQMLNLMGSDICTKEIQDILDDEHAKLDPKFKALLTARRAKAEASNC